MKKFLLLLLVIIPFLCQAQQLSVAGVSLKDEYSRAESALENRYGVSYFKEHNEIKYFDFTVGGITYDSAEFEFIYRSVTQDRRLNSVYLSRHYKLSDLEEAKKFRDYVAEVYSRKYHDLETYTPKGGFKVYRCALDIYRDMFLILISLEKSQSKGGETFYYVTVSYGPAYKESTDDI